MQETIPKMLNQQKNSNWKWVDLEMGAIDLKNTLLLLAMDRQNFENF